MLARTLQAMWRETLPAHAGRWCCAESRSLPHFLGAVAWNGKHSVGTLDVGQLVISGHLPAPAPAPCFLSPLSDVGAVHTQLPPNAELHHRDEPLFRLRQPPAATLDSLSLPCSIGAVYPQLSVNIGLKARNESLHGLRQPPAPSSASPSPVSGVKVIPL